ncbi:hypothetical protein QVD17_12342 [Tagetes erecta]|uniref:HAT C-terminal dimerisation domain-containing protein n=1 Tax=Tagetes erecta TaxID=13708 RepID=A0AAD8P2V3_TARER|nr:hypothetical protein QVD17_12342 [Tagetes erecta]
MQTADTLTSPRMSYLNESIGGVDTPDVTPIMLSDEETVDGVDTTEQTLNDDEDDKKRKSKSEAWKHFIEVEVVEHGQKIKKHECIHCNKRYAPQPGAFHEARASNNSSTNTTSLASNSRARAEDDFIAYLRSRPGEKPNKTELEVYLKEPNYIVLKNMEFDVLKWWSQSCSKLPILSKMVRNILCIPVTTVALESAFSAGGRILNDYRSALTKDMVELLVCGGDWIKSGSKTTIQTLELSAMEEENLEIQIDTISETIN